MILKVVRKFEHCFERCDTSLSQTSESVKVQGNSMFVSRSQLQSMFNLRQYFAGDLRDDQKEHLSST
jgi:hypothetical protein